MRSTSIRMSVPLPAPEGPVTTMTRAEPGGRLLVEEPNELGALALGETPDRLRLADAALVQEPRRLDAPELRNGHQHVEHFRGRDEFRWIGQDLLDLGPSVLQVLLESRAPDPDVVCPLERFHPLVEGAEGRLGLGLDRRHGGAV